MSSGSSGVGSHTSDATGIRAALRRAGGPVLLGAAAIVTLCSVAGCPIHADEPRQNETWTDPPVRYGDVQFEGLRSPEARSHDGGARARPEATPRSDR